MRCLTGSPSAAVTRLWRQCSCCESLPLGSSARQHAAKLQALLADIWSGQELDVQERAAAKSLPYLLGAHRQHIQVDAVELIKAAPQATLCQTLVDLAHALVVHLV